jgi:hypothetical protein
MCQAKFNLVMESINDICGLFLGKTKVVNFILVGVLFFFFLIGMIHFISGAFQHVVSGLNYIYINLKLYKHNVVSKYISKILTFFGPRCGSDNFLT